jgi:asparagine synthase (glutamine-hydrolysing)
MFAFALHDARRGELIVARDRFGIKPLYYASLPDRFVFASEMKALLPLLPRPPRVHAPALAQVLLNQFSTGEETIFEGIHRLPPATAIAVDSGLRLERWTYWSPLDVRTRHRSFDEAAEEFEPLMETVMREHMRSDVPYGLFLSGGVDSAVLLAMLDRFQDRPVRTFSVGFVSETLKGELDDAQAMAERFDTEHTALQLDRQEVFHRLPHSVWANDDLMRDYATLPTSILSQRASRDLKVVFTGEGGDEAFAGYGRYRSGALERWFKRLRAGGTGGFRTRGRMKPRWVRQLFRPRLAEAAGGARAPFVRAWAETPRAWSFIQRAQYTDIVTALPDNLLLKADRMMMGFGLEGRVPFVDHRIVEFGLSLPDELKVRQGQGKLFLKRWAERFIPPDPLYRRKRGFYVPIQEWLSGAYLDDLERKLTSNEAIRSWFEPAGLAEIFRAQRRGARANREVWSLMQFAIWHRLFVESPGAKPEPESNPLDWIG